MYLGQLAAVAMKSPARQTREKTTNESASLWGVASFGLFDGCTYASSPLSARYQLISISSWSFSCVSHSYRELSQSWSKLSVHEALFLRDKISLPYICFHFRETFHIYKMGSKVDELREDKVCNFKSTLATLPLVAILAADKGNFLQRGEGIRMGFGIATALGLL